MFKINNQSLLKKIAKQNLKYDKQNSFFVILTIVVAVTMIYSAILVVQNKEQVHKQTQTNKAQIAIIGLNDEQFSEISASDKISWIGQQTNLGVIQENANKIVVLWENTSKIIKQDGFSIEGKQPQKKNEIMVSANWAKKNRIQLDSTFSYDLAGTGREQLMTVTGIVQTSENSGYYVWVNDELARKLYADTLYTTTSYIRMNTKEINSNRILDYANKIMKETSVTSNQVMLTEYFAVMTGADREGYYGYYILTGIVIILLSTLIIYSIFYNSIVRDIQMYGQLRTLGLTKKQIKKILKKEIHILCLITIPLGLILGLFLSYCLQSEGFQVVESSRAAFFVSVLIYISIRCSLIKPLKIATTISPIEAKLFEQNKGGKKGHYSRKISTFYFAWRNFTRHKKTTFFSITVLSLSVMSMLVTSMVQMSIDAEKKAEFNYFPDGQFQLMIKKSTGSSLATNSQKEKFQETKLQIQNNPLSDSTILKKIRQVEGCLSVKQHKCIYLNYEFSKSFATSLVFGDLIPIIDEIIYEKLQNLLVIPVDYKKFTLGGALVSEKYAKVGDKISISGREKDGKVFEKQISVIATYSEEKLMGVFPLVPGSPNIVLSDTFIENLTGVKDQPGILSIQSSPEYLNVMKEELFEIVASDERLELISKSQVADNISKRYKDLITVMYVISGVLFVFGFISLMNIRISSFILRKKEFGLYRMIGMTKKQLVKILDMENSIYLMFVVTIGLILGNLVGIITCYLIGKTQHIITLTYPIRIQVYLMGSVILIGGIFHVIILRSLRNSDFIEDSKKF